MKKLLICGILLLSLAATAQQPTTKERPTCTATTSKGLPCKGVILMQDGKCRSHSETTPRCGATTSKGTACKMAVKQEGQKCKHHTK